MAAVLPRGEEGDEYLTGERGRVRVVPYCEVPGLRTVASSMPVFGRAVVEMSAAIEMTEEEIRALLESVGEGGEKTGEGGKKKGGKSETGEGKEVGGGGKKPMGEGKQGAEVGGVSAGVSPLVGAAGGVAGSGAAGASAGSGALGVLSSGRGGAVSQGGGGEDKKELQSIIVPGTIGAGGLLTRGPL